MLRAARSAGAARQAAGPMEPSAWTRRRPATRVAVDNFVDKSVQNSPAIDATAVVGFRSARAVADERDDHDRMGPRVPSRRGAPAARADGAQDRPRKFQPR